MAQIKDLKRMCAAHENCEECPLRCDCSSPDSFSDNADEIVDKWVMEHPVKTYATDFFEKFPNAPKEKSGEPKSCIKNIYSNVVVSCKECETRSCYMCWNQKME